MRHVYVCAAVCCAIASLPSAVFATRASTVPVLKLSAPLVFDASDANAGIWSAVPAETLEWDVTHARHATEKTTARIATDGTYAYVRFEAQQRETIVASQRTNDVGLGSDDEVYVDLWPNGSSGYMYQFIATPIGTHYESSSENNAYAPTWFSRGLPAPGGYAVDMRIPFAVLRGAQGGGTWRAQFVRVVHATGETQVWSYEAVQTNADDVTFSGSLGMPRPDVSSRPEPRVAVYGLGSIASAPAGGSTSRSGADLSLPITQTASVYATIHPDFSNVELDQQSISPTAFQRYYSEVRPFFTQGANFYNQLNCDVCSGITELYTPAIPTPRDGYAIEGQQGLLGFGAFDAVGDGRNDVASSLDFQSEDQKLGVTLQRVAVTMPGFIDDTTTTGISLSDKKHASIYFDYGDDHGTNVLLPDDAQRYDLGGAWSSSTFVAAASTRKVGDDYLPTDGFIQHAGIAGYGMYANKIWLFDSHSALESIALGGVLDRYHGSTLGLNQTDNEVLLDVLTRSLVDVQVSGGSDYLRLPNDIFTPVSQNGVVVTYHSGSSQNPGNFGSHGSSATPTSVTYYTGRYGDGRLDSWLRSSTLRVGMRGTLTGEVDDTDQRLTDGSSNVQWFERLSYAYQLGHDTSFAFGLRKVTGTPPAPNGGGNCIGSCTNISFNYHLKARHSEVYVGYGDPSQLITVPQLIFKYIYYFGAEKGT
jgi:hypothetical protein